MIQQIQILNSHHSIMLRYSYKDTYHHQDIPSIQIQKWRSFLGLKLVHIDHHMKCKFKEISNYQNYQSLWNPQNTIIVDYHLWVMRWWMMNVKPLQKSHWNEWICFWWLKSKSCDHWNINEKLVLDANCKNIFVHTKLKSICNEKIVHCRNLIFYR